MKVLRLFSFSLNVKTLEPINLFLQLNNESDFSRDTKVCHDNEANTLKKSVSRNLLLIPPMNDQVFLLNWADLHDIAYVQ